MPTKYWWTKIYFKQEHEIVLAMISFYILSDIKNANLVKNKIEYKLSVNLYQTYKEVRTKI